MSLNKPKMSSFDPPNSLLPSGEFSSSYKSMMGYKITSAANHPQIDQQAQPEDIEAGTRKEPESLIRNPRVEDQKSTVETKQVQHYYIEYKQVLFS